MHALHSKTISNKASNPLCWGILQILYLGTCNLPGYFGEGLAASIGAAAFNTLHVVVAMSLTNLGAELIYRFVETVLRARGRVIAARQLPPDS